tara:strand:- start:262 stop:546 length:285 start_codon:yes stop_codon:yes gene_type:complete
MILNVDKHAKKYIEFIKTKVCTVCYDFPVDPDHLITVGMGNKREKPRLEDFTCIPLCRKCHIERHQIGNIAFELKHGVNLWKDAYHYLMEFLTQ